MSRTFANWENYSNGRRVGERTSSESTRAERILSRAEGRVAPATSRTGALAPVTIDNMDKLALAVAVIMTIGPLFAAYVGSLMVSP